MLAVNILKVEKIVSRKRIFEKSSVGLILYRSQLLRCLTLQFLNNVSAIIPTITREDTPSIDNS